MEVVILPTDAEVALAAADVIATLVAREPRAVLGLATGRTPLLLYAELVRRHREEGLTFAEVTTFNLDEIVGLGALHPASYRYYMHEHFFGRVDLPPARAFVPDGMASDVEQACADYEDAIRAVGGIDLQLLGIGRAGHIGFNEPTSSLASRTRMKTLTPLTLGQMDLERSDAMAPQHVITMGVGTILEARRCLVLATGAQKAQTVAQMVEGPLTAMVPASALQLHPRTTVLLDAAAAGQLALRDYYREVHRGKPGWQRQRDGV